MLIEALDYTTRGVSLDEKLTPLSTWDSNLRVFFFNLEVSGQTHLLRACSEKRKHNNNNT